MNKAEKGGVKRVAGGCVLSLLPTVNYYSTRGRATQLASTRFQLLLSLPYIKCRRHSDFYADRPCKCAVGRSNTSLNDTYHHRIYAYTTVPLIDFDCDLLV